MQRIEVTDELSGDLASLPLGDAPTPLSFFFPEGSRCEELDYGQDEGQVAIDGEEWGFSWNDRGGVHAVRHDGTRSLE